MESFLSQPWLGAVVRRCFRPLIVQLVKNPPAMQESACNAGDPGLIPDFRRFPGEGNGNPLQYSCLENPIDRGAWQAAVHGVARVGHDLATTPPPPPGPCMLCFWSVMKHLQQDLRSSQNLLGHLQRYRGDWVWGEIAPCCPIGVLFSSVC